MAILLSNEEVQEALNARGYVDAMEEVFKELGRGAAINCPRTETSIPITKHPASRALAAEVRKKMRALPADADPRHSPAAIRAGKSADEVIYRLKTMPGGYPKRGVMALRIDSTIDTHPIVNGIRRSVKLPLGPGWRYTGIVMLFSLATGEVLGILAEGVLQKMRVGATSAVGVKHLSRRDAHNVGLFGTGWQAEGQLETVSQVRKLKTVRVYSPNAEHRKRFATMTEKRIGVSVIPVEKPKDAFQDADIILTATTSSGPVFKADWLEPGMHLGTISGDYELGVLKKSDVVVVNTHPFGGRDLVHDFVMGGVEKSLTVGRMMNTRAHRIDWEKTIQLGDLLNGGKKGRNHPSQITFHTNNIGLGMQFAAAGARILEGAREKGLGKEIPTEWFLQKEHT